MILTTHALTGAVIGKTLDNPWLIIPVALALHFLLDTFRHGEYLNQQSQWKEFWKVALDIVIGFSIIFSIIFFRAFPAEAVFNIFLGTFFSMLPDLNTFLYWKLNFKFLAPIFRFHHWAHRPENPEEEKWNLRNFTNDAILCLLSIFLLLL